MNKLFPKIVSIVLFILTSTTFSQVLSTSQGKVEFIGLKSMDAKTLLDSLLNSDPQKSLRTCVATLKNKYKFADASVSYYSPASEIFAVLTVVEPKDKSKIVYLAMPKDSMPIVSKWHPLNNFFLNSINEYQAASQFYGKVNENNIDSIAKKYSNIVDSSIASNIYKTLLSFNKESDKKLALSIIKSDRNFQNRFNATLILRNFLDSDSTWCQLVELIRDRQLRISLRAISIIARNIEDHSHQIDWSPAVTSLQYLLDGTNLLAFPQILNVLTKTKISPDLASILLKGHHFLLLEYLKAISKTERESAHNFLIQISDKDYGYNFGKWEDWIKSL